MKQPIWIVPLMIAGIAAMFGLWAHARLRSTLEAQLEAKLNSTLEANVTALEVWTSIQTRLAKALADEPDVQSAAVRLLQSTDGGVAPQAQDVEELSDHLRPRLRRLNYELAQLVSTNYTITATLAREGAWPRRPGAGAPGVITGAQGDGTPVAARANPVAQVAEAHTNKFAELFATGEPIIITPFKPEYSAAIRGWRGAPPGDRAPWRQRRFNDSQRRRGDITLMQVAAPVTDNGSVRGALALVINPTNEFTRILTVARTGDTGETYAFDQTGLLISQSRFDAQLHEMGLLDETNRTSALNLRLHDPGANLTAGSRHAETNLASLSLTRIVARAVEGGSGVDVTPSRDYRGVAVVGAWRWLPELGFGVATQIDADEAYQPLHLLQALFVVLFLLLVLCSVGLFLFSYVNAKWRRRLSEAQLKLKQLGQYTLEEKIGQGGMGTVYRARHALLRRDTAVKLLSSDHADPVALERFEREVRLTCQLSHPNTIQVYDYGHTPEGVFYYAMEYLRGLNLHELVAHFGPQPEGRVVHILIQVCESLREAHALGLVHRDIKPANVFLCERGGIPDSVKVLDFGLVREYGPISKEQLNLTGEDGFVGTPCFMPPEAFKGRSRSDPRSDIYSVAALGYYLLTGCVVFEGESVVEIYEKQLTSDPAPPSERTKNSVSKELEGVLLRCLRRNPEDRPATVQELRDLLAETPNAHSFSEKDRSEWWANFHERAPKVHQVAPNSSSPDTVRIDFESRVP